MDKETGLPLNIPWLANEGQTKVTNRDTEPDTDADRTKKRRIINYPVFKKAMHFSLLNSGKIWTGIMFHQRAFDFSKSDNVRRAFSCGRRDMQDSLRGRNTMEVEKCQYRYGGRRKCQGVGQSVDWSVSQHRFEASGCVSQIRQHVSQVGTYLTRR